MDSVELITNKAALKRFINRRNREETYTALDFETTSLDPRVGRVRLVSLCDSNNRALVDFDRMRGGFRAVAHLFEGGAPWVVFNHSFEDSWFRDAGVDVDLFDVQHVRRSVVGGSQLSLALMAKWDLGVDLDKTQQTSNWGAKKLSEEQLKYAFEDAEVTWDLLLYWLGKSDSGTLECAQLLNDLERPVRYMQEAGMMIDTKRHRKLIGEWEALRDRKVEAIRELVGEDEVPNINSNTQWSTYFSRLLPDSVLKVWPRTEKSGQLEMSTDQLRKMAGAFPGTPLETALDALADYKRVSKYLSSFGETLITRTELSEDGRIHARFNIGAARTLRFSCSSPNLQQIPRDQDDWFGEPMSVRQSFVEPRGYRIVSLDYSAIELRVLALLSGDEQLLHDVVHGDVHAEVAAQMIGRKLDLSNKTDKTYRTNAKRVSFAIVYGSSSSGLALTLRTSVSRAQEIIDGWEARYPEAFRYRYDMYDEAASTRYIRMIDGGTIHMGSRPSLPQCANYPVQRAAWTVMARAILRHHASLEDARSRYKAAPGTQMIGTIHDALMDRVPHKFAQEALMLMHRDMVDAYIDVFPHGPPERLVEGGIGTSWGSLVESPVSA